MKSKIEDNWKSILEHRRKELEQLIGETTVKTKEHSLFDYGKVYPIELTKAFDSEEPKQWVYIKLVLSIQLNKAVFDVSIGEQEYDLIYRVFEAVEVYNEPDDLWIDHVSRIAKEGEANGDNQIYFENTIFGNGSNSGETSSKSDDSKNN